MFWPVFYMIYVLAFAIILTRFPQRVLLWFLPLLFALQVADSWEGMLVIHNKLRSNRDWKSPLQDKFWTTAAKHYRKILYVMPVNAPPNYFPLCFYAASNDMAIDIGAFARFDRARQQVATDNLKAAIKSGSFDPAALYVFEQDYFWNMAQEHRAAGDRAGVVDGFRILAPGWADCAECSAAKPLEGRHD
jgi:hypothetical protein